VCLGCILLSNRLRWILFGINGHDT
jgi:hypothetical protein